MGVLSKIVFLDIDGVLNNVKHCEWLHFNEAKGCGYGQPWELDAGNFSPVTVGWDPENVKALHHIIDETNADIIISSTWRRGRTAVFFRQCFAEFGWDRAPVRGMTGVINEIGSIRGDEVNDFLANVKTDAWVCLDDDGDFHPENNLVQTNGDVGLTFEDAARAIEILNKE